jgi:hypothetical protein
MRYPPADGIELDQSENAFIDYVTRCLWGSPGGRQRRAPRRSSAISSTVKSLDSKGRRRAPHIKTSKKVTYVTDGQPFRRLAVCRGRHPFDLILMPLQLF